MSSDVLAVVVAWNNLHLTQRAVESLRQQTVATKIVVWDNASTDGTREWLAAQDDLCVHLSDENVYWTPAVNGSIAKFHAEERTIVWLNNDAAPGRSCMQRLDELLQSDKKIGLVAPATNMIGGPQDTANCETIKYVGRGSVTLDSDIAHLPPKRGTFVLGACAGTRSDVWDRVGSFDEEMVLGADDHDWAVRAKDLGFQVWIAQNAFCEHQGHASATAADGASQWEALGGKSWGVFNQKWVGYFFDEREAVRCHWSGRYFPFYDFGTGWLFEADREKIQAQRDGYEAAHPELYAE